MNYSYKETKQKFDATENFLKTEYGKISAGRISPTLIDGILVQSYGAMQPIKSVATVTVEDARTLRVKPWDRDSLRMIEVGLREADLQVSIMTDSEGVRISVPQLTEESRTALTKLLKQKLEDARVAIRMERQKAEKEIEQDEKDGEFAEDEKFRLKTELQKAVDEANASLEAIYAKKEEEVMTI